jgi:hypothetical protein
MSIRTLYLALVALAALVLVASSPTAALAHGVRHIHAAEQGAAQTARDVTVRSVSELRAAVSIPAEQADEDGCPKCSFCGISHCSGAGLALAPASWMCPRISSDAALLSLDAAVPLGLAREGPSRPPKSFV